MKKLVRFEIEEGSLYKAGITEDGEEILVFDRFILAYDPEGNAYVYKYNFSGCCKDPEGFLHPNYSQENEAKKLIDTLSNTPFDPGCWERIDNE